MKPYQLIDSGGGRKLEIVGDVRIERQAAVAFWKSRKGADEWRRVDAFHHRSQTGGGHWEFKKKGLPESWTVTHGGLQLKVKLTSFGHLGFFAEQAREWDWLRGAVTRAAARLGRPPRMLNLFGYTGGSSIAMALAGADVTHVDAAKGVVDWCGENAELNRVPEGRLRLIVDDAKKFVEREQRRGKTYDGVVLDPPSYGRGPSKEVFKIEDDIGTLLETIAKVLGERAEIVHFSSHSPGFTPEVLFNLGADTMPVTGMKREGDEMWVAEAGPEGRKVPSGMVCRWERV